MKTYPFPLFETIQKWSDEELLFIIKTGNSNNWDILFEGENQSDLDEYMTDLFNEADYRQLKY